MALWRLALLLSLALAAVQALDLTNSTLNAGSARRLAGSAPGNIAVCYTPWREETPPRLGDPTIDGDFAILRQYVTHVRTYRSIALGASQEFAPIAAKYGLKLYLGVDLISDQVDISMQIDAVVKAIKKYPDTVEAVLVGNDDLSLGRTTGDILPTINKIKNLAGGDAWRVKYGTAQRIENYMNDPSLRELSASLDILGVNIYPFTYGAYSDDRPTETLDAAWKALTRSYPNDSDKFRLTETGFPSNGGSFGGAAFWLETSFNFYEGVVNWNPSNYQDKPKFWYEAFDRRNEIPSYENYFGLFSIGRNAKGPNFPRIRDSSVQPTTPSTCVIENGVDYTGNDISNTQAARAEDCFAKCNSYGGCGAFTWSSYNGGTCWLKSSKGSTTSSTDARSATTCKCNLGGLEADVDYSGNDIANSPGSNGEACISICQGTSGCRAFTWSSYNGGTCWLKSGKGNTASSAGVTSGVIC